MDFISILHYRWNFPPQVYAAETTFNKSFLCTQYSKIIPTKMSYMYISFKMIFLQKIISQSPESGSPQVSLNSNFLGRVTTITWNYCLLSPGMCYKNIIQQSFSEYTIGLLVGGGVFFSFGSYSAVPHYSKNSLKSIIFFSVRRQSTNPFGF